MTAKARHYLGGGTRLVWVVWPQRREVDVWRLGNSHQPAMTLNEGDMLTGESVVPGFSFPVSDVFADPLG